MEPPRRSPMPSPTQPVWTSAKFPSPRKSCRTFWRVCMSDAAHKIQVQCAINGHTVTLQAYPMARLLDVLREQPGLTGTKEGCGEGECGTCAIEMNGALVNSCLVPAAQADGATIRTIEGVADHGRLHSVQQAFLTHGGAQCGICTPGMILAVVNLLARNPQPSE